MNAQNFWLVIGSVRVEVTARTGVAMLGGFFSKNQVHFNFFKLRQIFLKLK